MSQVEGRRGFMRVCCWGKGYRDTPASCLWTCRNTSHLKVVCPWLACTQLQLPLGMQEPTLTRLAPPWLLLWLLMLLLLL